MCVIEDPVIPDTKASLSVLYPSVILVSFKESHTMYYDCRWDKMLRWNTYVDVKISYLL